MKPETFDFAKWFAKLLFPPQEFKAVNKYILDDQALKAHLLGHDVLGSGLAETFSDLPQDLQERFTASLGADLDSIVATLGRQLLVLAATYTEAFLYEFLLALFAVYPERMHQVLTHQAKSVDEPASFLKLVLLSPSKEDILAHLRGTAAKSVTRGKIRQTLRKISELANYKCDDNLIDGVEKLYELRNQIVHEAHEPAVGEAGVRTAFAVADTLLLWIRLCAYENSIDVVDIPGLESSHPR